MNLATQTAITGADVGAPPPLLAPAELAPHFPQLEILECLGRGGMGVVYKARQRALDRIVALKLLAPERAHDAKFAERFVREAQALARLSHSNIVTVHDFGRAGGFYFLLMEFVDGVNLRELLRARRLTPEEALAIVPPLCDALQFAHERGIVHRDIKPENLLLDRQGRIKIADFGIARMLAAEPAETAGNEAQPAGTPGYMAPEQKSAAPSADSRADIYSLGVVLYEMLTGELPTETLRPPSASLRGMQIDVRLDEIVLRALENEPERRYQSAAELRTQVETITQTRAQAERARESASPGPAVPRDAARPSDGWGAAALTVVVFFAVLLPSVIMSRALNLVGGRLIVLLLALVLVGCPLAAQAALRGLRRWRAGQSPSARSWIRAAAWVAFGLAIPVVGLGLFFAVAALTQRGPWHPGYEEAIVVPLIWVGSVLLPWAGVVLLRATAVVTQHPQRRFAPVVMTLIASAAVALLLVVVVGWLVVASYQGRRALQEEARARAVAAEAAVAAQMLERNRTEGPLAWSSGPLLVVDLWSLVPPIGSRANLFFRGPALDRVVLPEAERQATRPLLIPSPWPTPRGIPRGGKPAANLRTVGLLLPDETAAAGAAEQVMKLRERGLQRDQGMVMLVLFDLPQTSKGSYRAWVEFADSEPVP